MLCFDWLLCVSVQIRKLQLTEEGGSDNDDSLVYCQQEIDKEEVNVYRERREQEFNRL